MAIVRRKLSEIPPISEQQLKEIAAIRDEDIDLSDIPEATEEFWKNARVVWPKAAKDPLSLRLDADIVAWFKAQGRGYQTRINAVLRSYVEAQRTGEKKKPRRRKAVGAPD